jgi:hypothetical protein
MHALPNGRRIDAEYLGHFGGRQLFEIAEHECRPARIGEPIDGVARFFGEGAAIG